MGSRQTGRLIAFTVLFVLAIAIVATMFAWIIYVVNEHPPSVPAKARPVMLPLDLGEDTTRAPYEDRLLRVSRATVRPPVPTPAPVVKPKVAPQPVVQKKKSPPKVTPRTATVPQHFGTAYLVAMAKCIRSHESGVYTRNSGNGYYGAYQINDRMWHNKTHLSGHASDYPKAVQDYYFMKIWSKLKTDRVRQQQWTTYKYCDHIRP